MYLLLSILFIIKLYAHIDIFEKFRLGDQKIGGYPGRIKYCLVFLKAEGRG